MTITRSNALRETQNVLPESVRQLSKQFFLNRFITVFDVHMYVIECQNACAEKKRDNYKIKKEKVCGSLRDTNQLSLKISGLRFIHYTKSKHPPLTKGSNELFSNKFSLNGRERV